MGVDGVGGDSCSAGLCGHGWGLDEGIPDVLVDKICQREWFLPTRTSYGTRASYGHGLDKGKTSGTSKNNLGSRLFVQRVLNVFVVVGG